ncbi:bola-like protein, partial [Rhodotorula sp. JG-1b]
GEQALKAKLEEKLQGAKVDVQDVSGGCGSFYAISVEHESFKGLTMIKQHRLVNDLLKDDIKDMHGLQV